MSVKSGAPAIELKAPVTGVMVATPMYGGLNHDAYLHGMIETREEFSRLGLPLHIVTIRNESLIQRARNHLVARFLASDASHLIFIDADIGFTARDLLRLVAHDKPLVGATYAKKNRERADFAFVPLAEGVRVTEGQLIEVEMLPTGFLCIKRDTLQRMAGAFAHRRYVPSEGERKNEPWEEHLFMLFDVDICPVARVVLSEDYLFCRRWREMGGQVFLDPNILLDHHGTSVFDGDPTTVFSIAPAAAPPAAVEGGSRSASAELPPRARKGRAP